MRKLTARFVRDEAGLELSEYAIMVGLIVLILVAAITGLSNAIGGAFNRTAANIESAGS